MSAPHASPAGRALQALAEHSPLPPADFSAAAAAGSVRRQVRRVLATVLVVVLVGSGAAVHQRLAEPTTVAARTSSPRAQAALASLVRRAVVTSAPGASLLWDGARVGPAARVSGALAVTAPGSVLTDTVGAVPFARHGTRRAVLAYRVTVRRPGVQVVDPCSAAGPFALPGESPQESGCGTRRFLDIRGGMVVRAGSRVLGGQDSADSRPPRLEQVREVILVQGGTTYAIAARWSAGDPRRTGDLVAPLSDAELSLAVRYLATSTHAGGPGV